MNVLFMTSSSKTHLIPLDNIFQNLFDNNCHVYCMSTVSNKNIIETYGAEFIQYPFDLEDNAASNNMFNQLIRIHEIIRQGEVERGFELLIETDIRSIFNVSEEHLDELINIVKEKNIDLIFRDSVDRYGRFISEIMEIPCIGYITNNLYSKKYFEQDPKYLYSVFMDALKYEDDLPKDYFKNFREKIEKMYIENHKNIKSLPIYPHNQFDPMTDFTLICSTNLIQPSESFYSNREYQVVYPNIKRFMKKESVSEELKTFVDGNYHLVYVSSGSLISFMFPFYIKVIEDLIKFNYKIVISTKHYKDDLLKFINKIGASKQVYVSNFVPQNFILSKADFFITHGGQNSAMEAIFHKVPLLVCPLTSEQRMNGLTFEKKRIGITMYKKNNKSSLIEQVDYLVNNKEIQDNLVKHSTKMKEKINDFEGMWRYINKKLNK